MIYIDLFKVNYVLFVVQFVKRKKKYDILLQNNNYKICKNYD